MTTFRVFVSYSQLSVFDPSLAKPFNNWTRAHVAQGFAWRPGSVSFKTLSESEAYDVELLLGEGERPTSSHALRVIEVPFLVPSNGSLEVASIGDGKRLELPPGSNQLRFEALPKSKIRLVFTKGREPKFLIVRADADLAPPTPLLKTAEPA
jgi:Competence protein J (ComJ)